MLHPDLNETNVYLGLRFTNHFFPAWSMKSMNILQKFSDAIGESYLRVSDELHLHFICEHQVIINAVDQTAWEKHLCPYCKVEESEGCNHYLLHKMTEVTILFYYSSCDRTSILLLWDCRLHIRSHEWLQEIGLL